MIYVTVILPIYNGEEYLEQCVESVLSQTLKEIELLCVDDGSMDNSAQIIRNFSEKDKRIRLFQQSNQGPGLAKNLGLNHAQGKYIAFLDADDYYLDTDALEKMVYACEEKQVFICASLRKTLTKGIEIEEDLFQDMDKNKVFDYINFQMDYNYQSYLFNRNFLLENNFCFPNYRRYEDPVFLSKVLFKARKLMIVDTYLYCYRLPSVMTRFTPEKTYDLLKGIEDNLLFSIENKLDALFKTTLYRLEYEYMRIILKNIPENNLEIIYLLLHLNRVVCKQMKNEGYIIRPLRGIALCSNGYEKDILKKIQQKKRVCLYGAGMFGRIFFLYLKEYGLSEKIEKFIVSKKENNLQQLEGIPVIILDELDRKEEPYILVATGERSQKDIEENLLKNGYKDYELLNEVFLSMAADMVNNL